MEMESSEPADQQAPSLNSPTKIRRKKPHLWKSNISKRLRLQGQEYTSSKGKQRCERKPCPMCTSDYCKKSELRNCSSLNENDRLQLFTTFWEMQPWEARRKYVQALVTRQPIKQKKNINSSKRHISLSYVLEKEDGNVVPVCKEMFCNT